MVPHAFQQEGGGPVLAVVLGQAGEHEALELPFLGISQQRQVFTPPILMRPILYPVSARAVQRVDRGVR